MIIDLCSGEGGFSQAFKQAGQEVITIDIDRGFKPTIQADVRFLPLRENLQPDLLFLAPPCNHFSVAGLGFGWPRRGIQRALEIVGACLEAVAWLNPKYWIMENPRGMLRVAIGKPAMETSFSQWGDRRRKLTDLWGRIPPMGLLSAPGDHDKVKRGQMNHRRYWLRSMSIGQRSKIPFELSRALLNAMVSTQKQPDTG
jgi:site-specific DNA-cytosine methylase